MNPYKILNIDRNAGKKEIIKSVTLALRLKKFSAKEIALAQKELMNPVTRIVSDFSNFIDVKPFLKDIDLSGSVDKEDKLTLLKVFDGARK